MPQAQAWGNRCNRNRKPASAGERTQRSIASSFFVLCPHLRLALTADRCPSPTKSYWPLATGCFSVSISTVTKGNVIIGKLQRRNLRQMQSICCSLLFYAELSAKFLRPHPLISRILWSYMRRFRAFVPQTAEISAYNRSFFASFLRRYADKLLHVPSKLKADVSPMSLSHLALRHIGPWFVLFCSTLVRKVISPV